MKIVQVPLVFCFVFLAQNNKLLQVVFLFFPRSIKEKKPLEKRVVSVPLARALFLSVVRGSPRWMRALPLGPPQNEPRDLIGQSERTRRIRSSFIGRMGRGRARTVERASEKERECGAKGLRWTAEFWTGRHRLFKNWHITNTSTTTTLQQLKKKKSIIIINWITINKLKRLRLGQVPKLHG